MERQDRADKDWKLKLRYGKLKTPYKHFTALAEGIVEEELRHGYECPPGNAWMGIKTWASSSDESGDMACSIGEQIGFKVTGEILIYDTDPTEPPKNEPYGYGITFTPFTNKDEEENP
jgi:hypothetical protein